MVNSGYIKIHRKILEWEWYTDSNVMRVFLHCLIKANHKKKSWQGMEIERGSFVTSYSKLALELNLSIQQIRTAISKLKSTSEVTFKTTSKYSVISINNYDDYQESNKQINKQITNEQQTNNNQITTTNNEKNEKNEKNNINIDFAAIINYLNSKAKTKYKPTSKNTQKLIKARFNDKFTYEDFYKVIDNKCLEWEDTEWEKYLRPETLFSNKFESYLNQKVTKKATNNSNKKDREVKTPSWMDKQPKKENVSEEDLKKLQEELKEFKEV